MSAAVPGCHCPTVSRSIAPHGVRQLARSMVFYSFAAVTIALSLALQFCASAVSSNNANMIGHSVNFSGARKLLEPTGGPGPGEKGGTCAGIAGFKCGPGLNCTGIDPNPQLSDAAGVCTDANGTGSDPCANQGQPCEPGVTCQTDQTTGQALAASCNQTAPTCDCQKVDAPVCAADLKTNQNSTFGSPCAAGCAGALILYRGACASVSPTLCKCTTDAKPVCATDPRSAITMTYVNSCQAGCSSFPVVYAGACKDPTSVSGQKCDCGDIDSPVCAIVDRNPTSTFLRDRPREMTYKNLCTATCSLATKWKAGKCN